MPNFERNRPYDEHRVLFKLFAQLLKETWSLPLPKHVAKRMARFQLETEEFLAKMRLETQGREFNLSRFRVVSDPENPEEVV